MLSRVPVVSLSFAALLSAGSASALELQLPPPGEDVVGQVQVIKAKYEDTFADLGEQYNLGYSEMVAANPGVDPWLPGVGTEVIIPTRFVLPPGPREGVVINLAEYRLYYYPKGQNVVHTYPLGIGREGWGSPIANTRITAKTKDPAWYPPASIRAEHAADGDPLPTVVPPGPDNPLGPYKLTLGVPGYLIHGSNKKFGIGTRTSHGCFRMYNADVTHLFSMISVGTSVRIINEPYKFGVEQRQGLPGGAYAAERPWRPVGGGQAHRGDQHPAQARRPGQAYPVELGRGPRSGGLGGWRAGGNRPGIGAGDDRDGG